MTTLYTWASNTQKLCRIIDNMPQADEATLKEEYIKQGGLLSSENISYVNIVNPEDTGILNVTVAPPKKKESKVKEAVKKIVKKVTKK